MHDKEYTEFDNFINVDPNNTDWFQNTFNANQQAHIIYATIDEADAYMFYRCFFLLFSVSFVLFCFFPSVKKIPDKRSRERLNGFSWNFYQTIAGKM